MLFRQALQGRQSFATMKSHTPRALHQRFDDHRRQPVGIACKQCVQFGERSCVDRDIDHALRRQGIT